MRAPEDPLIVIAGSIGVGKSSLAAVMRDHFSIPAWIERADLNPYLAGLYEDPARWAYRAHEVFLDLALARQRDAGRVDGPAVVDRSPQETVEVFARMLSDMGYVTRPELARLGERLETGVRELARPSLMLYLSAPVTELHARIHSRAWQEERGITTEYLCALEAAYERFVQAWSESPILEVDTLALDVRVPENVEGLLASAGLELRPR